MKPKSGDTPAGARVEWGPVRNGDVLARAMLLPDGKMRFESWSDGAWRRDPTLTGGVFLSNEAEVATPYDFAVFGVPPSERVYEYGLEIPSEWLTDARMESRPDDWSKSDTDPKAR